ncbi:hypothetical protein K431DRAFT_323846 [Polychaeton citri CBS 116435]|uniref:BTB domain-containing protein n=1 Tax=Polychaeton citri CBS 116435 TaxID=1314669 RepID=A0A9P4Q1J1_9PEZI|nr:hypothetical protein K431DRAFT_323846 [Polychaeton citri CBS 116435]
MPFSQAQNELMSALSTLHLGGKYSDLKIVCNYKEWYVHKAIVCSRSGFFDGACSAQMREAGSGVVDLSEDDEDAVDQMIHFLYHLDYNVVSEAQPASPVFRHRAVSDARRRLPKKLDLSQIEDPLVMQFGSFTAPAPERPMTPPSPTSPRHDSVAFPGKQPRSPKARTRNPTPPLDSDSESECECEEEEYEDEESHLLLHTRVYALAEKYDIPSLKQLSRRKFEIALACYWDSPDFADTIDEVYNSTVDSDRGLRDIVLQAFRTHPQLATTKDVYAIIKDTPSLAFELFKIERGIPV